jgi:hypothetical protein
VDCSDWIGINSSRCDVMPCLAQTRATVMREMAPRGSAANLREDQCIAPSAGLRLVLYASTRVCMRMEDGISTKDTVTNGNKQLETS